MSNITRFNPTMEVTNLDPFEDSFDDCFRGFFLWPKTLGPRSEQPTAFKVDVTENDEAYRVQAEIPGVSKEDIDVRIDGAEIAISAEVKRERDVKDDGGTVLRSERVYGKMYRAFTLDEEVEHAKAQARYTDGVLELILPKAAGNSTKRKRITVH